MPAGSRPSSPRANPPPIYPSGHGGIYQLVSPEAAARAARLAVGKPVPPPHALGGGIPGITPIARDWASAAVGVPAGLAAIGKAYGADLGDLRSEARAGKRVSLGQAMPHHLIGLLRGMAVQTAQDFQHPLRHPGFTLLDLAARGLNAEGSATRFADAEHAAQEAATSPLAKLPAAVPKRSLPPISPRVMSPSTAAAAKSLMGTSMRTPRQRLTRDAAYTSRDAIQGDRAGQTRAAQLANYWGFTPPKSLIAPRG
jgi:hypothetical protein